MFMLFSEQMRPLMERDWMNLCGQRFFLFFVFYVMIGCIFHMVLQDITPCASKQPKLKWQGLGYYVLQHKLFCCNASCLRCYIY